MSAATYSLSPFGRVGGSYLAPDLTIRGRIETSGSVEMDCEFHGDVLARQASVGPNGRIRARISAEEATVSGEMSGIVTARQAFFRDGCHFRGEVEYESLGTEPNAEVDARLVPVMAGSSSLAIPTVRDLQEPVTVLPPASHPVTAAPPRVNLSMLAFLGGMIVAGVVTGILVVNPTTRGWKDQLLGQVLQPRADAVPSASVTTPPPAAPAVPVEEPRITPPPPPAIPPSLSQIMPTPAAQDTAPPATDVLETRSAAPAAPAPAPAPVVVPAPVAAAPVIPDLSPSPPLPRHEPADPTPTAPTVAETVPAVPVPAPVVQATPAALQNSPVTPLAATSAPTAPVTAEATAPALPVTAAPPIKADPPAETTKTISAAPDQIKPNPAREAAPPPAVPAPPAQTPLAAATKKPKPALPAGARGALQEVCSWELKCDSDNQCVSVRSCKMQ